MSARTLQLDDAVQGYLHAQGFREPEPCRALRARTEARDDAHLISSPEQIALLALIARLAGVRRVLEVGTFTGYTPLWLALELADARIVGIDRNDEPAAVARRAWAAAGVADRIELHVDDAAAVLPWLRGAGEAFDMAYIDADKETQLDTYEACLALLRPGSVIAVDNTLWKGRVADAGCDDEATRAVRAFNERVHGDDRVDLALVPVGDGMTLLRKRHPGR